MLLEKIYKARALLSDLEIAPTGRIAPRGYQEFFRADYAYIEN
tara:strand:+ start:11 stop:139 length:129 start_codon:yes stop_codon:yes gene_type:complete